MCDGRKSLTLVVYSCCQHREKVGHFKRSRKNVEPPSREVVLHKSGVI